MKTQWGRKLLRSAAIVPAAVALWLLVRDGLSALYWAICNALIGAWGVTSRNLYRAPGFVRVMTGYGSLIAEALGALLLLLITRNLRRRLADLPAERRVSGRDVGAGLALGAGMTAALWLIYVLAGTMRASRGAALSQPELLGYGAALLLIGALSLIARLAFAYALVYPLIRRQLGRWGALAVMAALTLLATAWDDSTRAVWLVNAALLTAVCCFSLEGRGNIGWIVGFRMAIFALNMLFGLPNANGVLCETYLVNSAWLNGGAAGMMAGLGMTAALMLLLGLCVRSLRRSPS